jgi:hypothetical protein
MGKKKKKNCRLIASWEYEDKIGHNGHIECVFHPIKFLGFSHIIGPRESYEEVPIYQHVYM